MTEEHPPLTINPKELNAGNVLVIAEIGSEASSVFTTRQGNLRMVSHEEGDGESQTISPMELVLGGLAQCVAQSLKIAIAQHDIKVPKFAVAINQSRADGHTKITCEVIVDAHLNEVGKELLKEAINFCPTRKILNADISVKIIVA